jgi:2-methylcitrate dehydratase PrpD
VPFSVALALTDDPRDPGAWARRLRDPLVLDLAGRIVLRARPEGAASDPWSATLTADVKDRRRLQIEVTDFPGTPTMPFAPDDLERKLQGLVPASLRPAAHRALERLMHLEKETSLDWLSVHPDC